MQLLTWSGIRLFAGSFRWKVGLNHTGQLVVKSDQTADSRLLNYVAIGAVAVAYLSAAWCESTAELVDFIGTVAIAVCAATRRPLLPLRQSVHECLTAGVMITVGGLSPCSCSWS